jgi:hypothetical protein
MGAVIEADYVVVGAGAMGMAFVDTLLTDTDATVALIDRRAAPGGHWNDAYPFVRLHGPSLNYGVNSRPLGEGRIEPDGANTGLFEAAGAAEICAYFDAVLRRRFLPSGRVIWLPRCDYREGEAVSLVSSARTPVKARRRLVDATFADTRTPATHPPAFKVEPGATCVTPTELARLDRTPAGYVVIGAGKTAIDCVLWLLETGADPDAITWVRPRDPWLVPRERSQPHVDFFEATLGNQVAELEAARAAISMEDLFVRLEAAGCLARIDPEVKPTMFRCATVSRPELEQLRRVRNVVRLGHVKAIERGRVRLVEGDIAVSPRHVHVHCTADAIPGRKPVTVFQPGRIVIQYARRCSTSFSAAFIAHVEATLEDDAAKNRCCGPVPPPREPADWARMLLQEAANRAAWAQHPHLRRWLASARVDGFSGMTAAALADQQPERVALMERYKQAAPGGLARLAELTAAA